MKKKLSLKYQARKRSLKNLLSSLILFEKITTTETLAKALKREAEKLISETKKNKDHMSMVRFAKKYLYGGAQQKLIDKKNSYKNVSLYRINERKGDGARKVLIQIELSGISPSSKKEKESKIPEEK
jgi:ribosomal protein L17